MEPAFIDQFYQLFSQAVVIGMAALSEAVMYVMILILMIRLFYIVAGFLEGREGMIGLAVSHALPVIVIIGVSHHWIDLTRTSAKMFMELGQIASGNAGHTIALFKISEILINGFRLIKTIWEYMASLGGGYTGWIKNFWFMGYYLGASLVILVSAFYVAYIIFRSNIEFLLHALGTLALLPLALSKETAWAIRNGIGGFVAHLINLMLLSVAVNIGQPMMDSATVATEPSYQQAGILAGVSVMYAGLCFIIRNMSQGYINGGPALSGGGGIGGAVQGLIKGGLAGAAFQLTRNHMQEQQQKERALNYQPQGGVNSGGAAGGSVGSPGAVNGASAVLGGRQWNDTPSPYAATLKTAKAGYRQAFESNVSQTPNLPNGFVDQVRADFDKVNIEAGKQGADLMRKGYWEQFGFGHSGSHSSNPQNQIKS